MIDLHSHSTASDGTLSPGGLMEEAHALGLKAIALTDHDTLDGLAEAQSRADSLGLRFVPGIELEISFTPGEFHLLGLGLERWDDSELAHSLNILRAHREKRNSQMIKAMRDQGIQISLQEVQQVAGGRVVGRPHFATVMVKKGLAPSTALAFERYLAVGRPFYILKQTIELSRALDLIHKAGGKAVVAHPLSLYISWGKIEGYFREWKELGIDGVEAWHSGSSLAKSRRMEKLARSLGLAVTGGSDYHGKNRKDRHLGVGGGGRAIPWSFLEDLFSC